MVDKSKLLELSLGEERVKKAELLSYHTYSKTGGPAEFFYIATTKQELINALNSAYELKVPIFILGGGTKVLISDKGVKGLVIKNRTGFVKVSGVKGKVGREGIGIEEALVEAESGATLNKVNEFLKEQNLKELILINSDLSTIGSAILLDNELQSIAQKITIWRDGDIFDIEPFNLNRKRDIVLSLILQIKSKDR